jgi:hypothetical protein
MAQGRASTLQEVLKPRIVRLAGGTVVGLGFYDVLCNQLGLPPLKTLVGMSGAIMPWWGWLLILQSVFVYALFEYVRSKVAGTTTPKISPGSIIGASTPPLPLKPTARLQLGSWAHVDEFKVSEAACLWAGYLPGSSYIFDKAAHPAIVGAERLIISELTAAINMDAVPFGNDDLCSGTISRQALLALAKRNGFGPVFLFPDANPA